MMARQSIEFQNIDFNYEAQSESLISGLSIQIYSGWTGVIGANGVGKSTLLKLATGLLQASQGNILIPGRALYCRQRTDDPPQDFSQFLQALDHEAFVIKGNLLIEDDWAIRWPSLSHGERKRAQIGTALWKQPAVLAIDEPTNHLDENARELLLKELNSFRGIGLVVSHDRELLDTLCKQCLYVDPPDALLRSGNFTQVWDQILKEQKANQKQHQQANREFRKLDREIKKRRAEASRADRKRSKRGIDKKDHDARFKINMARLTGKDAMAGKLMNQLEGRKEQAQKKLNHIEIKKSYETGIQQLGECSQKNLLFDLSAGQIALGDNCYLQYPQLQMKPDDRIALTGLNGCGKSTLLRSIMETINLPRDKVTYLPQEIDVNRSRNIIAEVNSLPSQQLGMMMTIINRLGTRPPRLLESIEPSPGEVRKVMLAIGVTHIPNLIVMDEPTNHLDLLSIQCIQDTLKEFPAGLLLISHDKRFLNELTTVNWHIRKRDDTINELIIV